MQSLYKLIEELSPFARASGSESALSAKISELVWPHADNVNCDNLGNVIAHKKGSGPKLLICAPMDSPGVVITNPEDKGFLRFAIIGDTRPEDLAGACVSFENETRGIVYSESKTDIKESKLYIDIGQSSQLKPGDTGTLCGGITQNGQRVFAPNLSSLASCAVLLSALARMDAPTVDIYAVFSAQHCVGSRGIKTAAFAIEPECALCIDAIRTSDTPGSSSKVEIKLGGGAGIKIMDDTVICHPKVIERLERAASSRELTLCRIVGSNEKSDAGALHLTRSGVKTGCVCLPVRYKGKPFESVDLEDMSACSALISAFVSL